VNIKWWRTLGSVTVVLTLVLAACSSNGTGSSSSEAASPSAAESMAEGSPTADLQAELNGAGASFPEPIYLEWIGQFQEQNSGVRINYQGIGSSGGREQFIAQQVDFAGSDAFMKDEEIQAFLDASGCAEVLHIPTVFGGVAIAYNIEGLDQIVLDGETIANIALGNITNVNDPAIAELNPDVDLPDQALTWVHRSDGSGTTSIFTKYLESVSSDWADQVGSGSEVEWPTGIGGDQNDGVAAAIAQQPGGIGYVSYEFANEAGLTVAQVMNDDGNAIAPSVASVSAAGETAEVPDDFRFNLLNIGGDGYPIAGATWILAPSCGMDANKADALKAFLTWALTDGDSTAEELNYAPLPDELQNRVLDQVDRINEEG
jgi:phosphate transport system substrate-binding protein